MAKLAAHGTERYRVELLATHAADHETRHTRVYMSDGAVLAKVQYRRTPGMGPWERGGQWKLARVRWEGGSHPRPATLAEGWTFVGGFGE